MLARSPEVRLCSEQVLGPTGRLVRGGGPGGAKIREGLVALGLILVSACADSDRFIQLDALRDLDWIGALSFGSNGELLHSTGGEGDPPELEPNGPRGLRPSEMG